MPDPETPTMAAASPARTSSSRRRDGQFHIAGANLLAETRNLDDALLWIVQHRLASGCRVCADPLRRRSLRCHDTGVGDSLSAGYGLPGDKSWVNLLAARLHDERFDYKVANASISGETTLGGRNRIEQPEGSPAGHRDPGARCRTTACAVGASMRCVPTSRPSWTRPPIQGAGAARRHAPAA